MITSKKLIYGKLEDSLFMFDSCEKDCEKVSTCERDAKTGETGKAGSFHTLPHLEVICGQKDYTP